MDRGLHDNVPVSFRGMTDEEIILYARKGSRRAIEYLLNKYRNVVGGKARSYFLVGAEYDDVVQEGMIGLFKAIRDFRGDKVGRFRAFAELCVTRQIITAVKTATRQKHMPLNRYISLHGGLGDGDPEVTLIDTLPDVRVLDPETKVLDSNLREYLNSSTGAKLSMLESSVLQCYIQGMSYREMARLLSCRTKSVDNALQRAKRKISDRIARD